MPLFSLKLPFAFFRGRVSADDPRRGIITTDAPTQGHTARAHNPHKPPATPAQLMIRAWTANSAKAWSALPAATAAAWRALAHGITRNNSLGYTYRLTGIGVFNQVNFYRLSLGLAIATTPPPLIGIPPPVTRIDELTTVGGNFHIRLICTGFPEGSMVAIRFTSSSSNQARLRQRHELRSPYPVPATYAPNVWGGILNSTIAAPTQTLVAGEYIGIIFTPMSTGFLPREAVFLPVHIIGAP